MEATRNAEITVPGGTPFGVPDNGVGLIRVYFQEGTNVDLAVAQVTAVFQTLLRTMPPGIFPVDCADRRVQRPYTAVRAHQWHAQ